MTGYVTIAVTPSALRSNSDGISEALPKISSVAIAETHKKAMRFIGVQRSALHQRLQLLL
jgi:hypothetical protein